MMEVQSLSSLKRWNLKTLGQTRRSGGFPPTLRQVYSPCMCAENEPDGARSAAHRVLGRCKFTELHGEGTALDIDQMQLMVPTANRIYRTANPTYFHTRGHAIYTRSLVTAVYIPCSRGYRANIAGYSQSVSTLHLDTAEPLRDTYGVSESRYLITKTSRKLR